MLKYLWSVCLLWCSFTVAGSTLPAVVYKVDVKDEIGPGMWRLVKKSFAKAEEAGAQYIVIDMNTYGGMVVYADSLRTLILNTRKPVWVFVDNNAASAGALISIACDKIYMKEGANIGAATVVNQEGTAMPDKYQSYMRSMIRATAQAHGQDTIVEGRDTVYRWKRDPRIAEAMVDETIYLSGVTDSGKVVTFTPHEAMKFGFCDGIVSNIDELLEREGIEHYVVESYQVSVTDKLIGFLVHPVVQGLLIMIIIGGIYFELQTPGIGFPLAAAVTACVLYFAPLYLEGIAAYWEMLLFIVGIVLLGLELFVIPGFGVAGVIGIVCVFVALVMAGVDEVSFEFFDDFAAAVLRSVGVVVTSSVVSLGLSLWLGSKLFGSARWGLALQAQQKTEDGYVGVDMAAAKELNREGKALTDLRPAGKVLIGEEIYDAVSELGDYILKDSPVKVIKYQSGQLYVEKKEEV